MRIFAIVNEKGGTAKTTTSVSLSAALGELGKKVLLVDLDGQAASSRWLGVEEDTRFADALWQGHKFEPIRDVIPNVSLAPGSGKLDSIAHDLRPTQGGQLRKILHLMEGFDYAIIDCPPSLGNRLIGNALLAATHAIVPVETSILALDGLKILLTTIQDVRDGFGHNIELAGVVACRYDARTKLSRMILQELQRALPDKVFKTVIRENVRLRECPASGQSILAYAPESHAAEDYRSLAREVVGLPIGGAAGIDIPEALQRDLTGEEAKAISDMHAQVDQMLRNFSPRGRGPQTMAAVQGLPDSPDGAEDSETDPAEEGHVVAGLVPSPSSIDATPLADLRWLPEDDPNEEQDGADEPDRPEIQIFPPVPPEEVPTGRQPEQHPTELVPEQGPTGRDPLVTDTPEETAPVPFYLEATDTAPVEADAVEKAAPELSPALEPVSQIEITPEPEPDLAPALGLPPALEIIPEPRPTPEAEPPPHLEIVPEPVAITGENNPSADAAPEFGELRKVVFEEPAPQADATPTPNVEPTPREDAVVETAPAPDAPGGGPPARKRPQDFPALQALLKEMQDAGKQGGKGGWKGGFKLRRLFGRPAGSK